MGGCDVIVVGVTDRCGKRVVRVRSSVLLGAANCDLYEAMLNNLVRPS